MLKAYSCGGKRLNQVDATRQPSGSDIIWYDLINPTAEESARVAKQTGLDVPAEEDIVEIENSSRLSADGDVLTMTMPIVARTDSRLEGGACGFILTPTNLVTIRFATGLVFDRFPSQPHDHGTGEVAHSAFIFVGLLEAIVDRQADALENMRGELDDFSHRIFSQEAHGMTGKEKRERDEEATLRRSLITLGVTYDNISFLRDSQLGVARIAPYVISTAAWLPEPVGQRLKTLQADIASLNEFSVHLTERVQFLLDATLGMINIAQSTLMKVFTVVAVVGIPPTLMAGIYGMNFKDMPELSWHYGYAYGWSMIILSAVLPLVWFRVKGWL